MTNSAKPVLSLKQVRINSFKGNISISNRFFSSF